MSKAKQQIKKILFVAQGDVEKWPAGTEVFIKNLARRLSLLPYRVFVLCASNAPGVTKVNGVTYIKVRYFNISFFSTISFNIQVLIKYLSLLTKINLDYAVFCGIGSAYSLMYLLKPDKTKRIYYAIDTMTKEYESKKDRLGLLARLNYRLKIYFDKKSCSVADMVLCSSRETLAMVDKRYNIPFSKLELCYFGIDEDFSKGVPRVREKLEPQYQTDFLLVATDHIRKGSFFFLDVLQLLRSRFKVYPKAIIIGDRDNNLLRLIQDRQLNVNVVPILPHEMMKWYFAGCKCLAVPSTSEGFCLVVIEAALLSRPAIVTAVGSLPEIVSDGSSGFVISRNKLLFAQKMMAILRGGKWEQMGESAKIYAQKFTLGRTVNTLDRILERREIG